MNNTRAYQSGLGPQIHAHVECKRALGRQFDREAGILGDLDRFLTAQGTGELTSEVFAAWSLTLERLASASRHQYLRIARGLCLYLRRTDPQCFVPDPASFPGPGPQRPALILSVEQIESLLQAATALPALVRSPLQPAVYRQAIALAYASGLRRGEIIGLSVDDCDLRRRTLHVRKAKPGRSRLVALSESAASELERYLRERAAFAHTRQAPLLTHGRHCSLPYSGRGIDLGFRRLFRATGIEGVAGRPARLHDLRHTHATHVLLRWYRQGIDPQAKLPVLMASMGHVSLSSTAYYLNQIEPVVKQAGERFAQYARSIVAPREGGNDA